MRRCFLTGDASTTLSTGLKAAAIRQPLLTPPFGCTSSQHQLTCLSPVPIAGTLEQGRAHRGVLPCAVLSVEAIHCFMSYILLG